MFSNLEKYMIRCRATLIWEKRFTYHWVVIQLQVSFVTKFLLSIFENDFFSKHKSIMDHIFIEYHVFAIVIIF